MCRLYNVKEDIGEQHNLAADMPEKVKELAGELTAYLKQRDAQRPYLKATGAVLPYPDGTVE